MQPCCDFEFSMIFTIKKNIGGWSDKFQDTVFKNASNILGFMFKSAQVNSITAAGKSEFLKMICFAFKKEYLFSISSGVR